jgi:hypothetical protein
MLFAEATPMGAGVTLWGDYLDLRSLYDTVGRMVDVAPGNIGDFIVALNYDIRHAYEHQRDEKTFGHDEIAKVTYLGEKILWPHVLVQASLVRYYAAFIDTTKEDQANIFRLEHALEQALRNYDAEVGETCAEWLATPLHLPNDYLTEFFDEATYRFIADGPGGKRRFKKLPSVLRSISEFSPEYRTFKSELEKIATEKGGDLHDLRSSTEFPEFEW